MGRILFLLTMLVALQLYAVDVYLYVKAREYSDPYTPMYITAGVLAITGVLGLIGRYLNNKDEKRGYCESGITQKQIDTYRNNHLARESYGDDTQTNHDHKSGDHSHENNDDQIR